MTSLLAGLRSMYLRLRCELRRGGHVFYPDEVFCDQNLVGDTLISDRQCCLCGETVRMRQQVLSADDAFHDDDLVH